MTEGQNDESVAALLALWAARPYMRDAPAVIEEFRRSIPPDAAAARLLPRGQLKPGKPIDWRTVNGIAKHTSDWAQPRKDRAGVELAVAGLSLNLDEDMNGTAYYGRIDFALEALEASFTLDAFLDELHERIDALLDDSKSAFGRVITHPKLPTAMRLVGLISALVADVGGLSAALSWGSKAGGAAYQYQRPR